MRLLVFLLLAFSVVAAVADMEFNGSADAATTAKTAYEELCKEPGTPRRMDEFKAALTGKFLPPVRLK